jgi:eukaryotic-like serine/threonine-protein kinase
LQGFNENTGYDLYTWSVERGGAPTLLVQTPFDERAAQFSPDGKWFAYESNESGRYEVYVQRFPSSGGSKIQVSPAGGAQVRWRAVENCSTLRPTVV